MALFDKETFKEQTPKKSAFTTIEEQLKGDTLGCNNLTSIHKWYIEKFEKQYGRKPFSTNYFYFQKVANKIEEKYKLTHWQLCQNINKWFTTFHENGWVDAVSDNSLEVSVLGTDWLVVNLMNDQIYKFSRNQSYKKTSPSRSKPIGSTKKLSKKKY